MITRLYTVRDTIAEMCGPIFSAKNDMVAMRQFAHICKEVADPSEMILMCFGVYDTDLGKITDFWNDSDKSSYLIAQPVSMVDARVEEGV